MNRVEYWNGRPEKNWPRTCADMWDRRYCIRAVAELMGKKPEVLEIGVDSADVLLFCHDVFGSYTGVDPSLVKAKARDFSGVHCQHAFIEKPSVDFWRSLQKTDLYDLIYVDGHHGTVESHLDVTQAMLRLAPGGYILAHDMGDAATSSKYPHQQDVGPGWTYNRCCNLPGWYSRLLEGHGEGMGIFFRENE